jgi:hypothetical protein
MTVTRFSKASLSTPTRYRSLMAGEVAAADYELISTTILGSSAASVTFSGLGTSAAAYKHLQIRAVARDNKAASVANFYNLTFNSDTTFTNYRTHELYGNGSSVLSATDYGAGMYAIVGQSAGASAATNAFGVSVIDIVDWQATKNKTMKALIGEQGGVYLYSSLWMSTAAITTMTLTPNASASFLTGSRFSLYGLK